MRVRYLVPLLILLASAPLAAQQPLALGTPVSGRLEAGDDTLPSGEWADAWRVTLRSGQRLELTLTSADFDVYLLVRGPGGFERDNDDGADLPRPSDSRIHFTAPADGDYRVSATSFAPRQGGAYTLRAAEAAAAPAVTAAPLAPGTEVAGALSSGDARLESGEYQDVYTFSGRRGERYEVLLSSEAFDAWVALADRVGVIAHNDDDVASGTRNSRLVAELPADGAYRVIATSYRAGETGAYRLLVRPTTALPTTGATAGLTLVPDSTVTGALEATDDTLTTGEHVDRFVFEGRSGQRISLDLSSDDFDAYLLLVSPTRRVEQNDDYAAGITHSRLETVLADSGRYTVYATSFARAERGAYQLTLRELGGTGGGTPKLASTLLPVLQSGVQGGRLEPGDETVNNIFRDRWSLPGVAGQRFRLHMTGPGLDPLLRLRGPGLAAPVVADDIAPRVDISARLDTVFPATGLYEVEATTFQAGQQGSYGLNLTLTAPPSRPGQPAPVAPAPLVAARTRPRVVGVFVGVVRYAPRPRFGLDTLAYVDRDAEKLAEVLRRAGVLAPESEVLVNERATNANIAAAFARAAAAARPDDVFIFFFSGHGGQLPGDTTEADRHDEYIFTHDAMISDDEMGRWFSGVRARVSIIALDACFSAGFGRDVIRRPGQLGLFASEEDLTSSTADKFQAGGYLSEFLRRGLAGAADFRPLDGTVEVGELRSYLDIQFDREVPNDPASTREGRPDLWGLQRPVFESTVKPNEPVVVLR